VFDYLVAEKLLNSAIAAANRPDRSTSLSALFGRSADVTFGPKQLFA